MSDTGLLTLHGAKNPTIKHACFWATKMLTVKSPQLKCKSLRKGELEAG